MNEIKIDINNAEYFLEDNRRDLRHYKCNCLFDRLKAYYNFCPKCGIKIIWENNN